MIVPITLPLEDIVPPQDLFATASRLHGQAHVARVMVHAFNLIEATGTTTLAIPLWAAVYLHDLARTHDGPCSEHGAAAVRRRPTLAPVSLLFHRVGVRDDDVEAIDMAVTNHCRREEVDRSHAHWRLIALLKDADALDRVRVPGGLDRRLLRHNEARGMISFAERLFCTSNQLTPGPSHFAELWPLATALLES